RQAHFKDERSLPEPMMLLRGRASQSLETAVEWPPTSSQTLERKDRTALRPEVAQGARRDASEQRQGTSRSGYALVSWSDCSKSKVTQLLSSWCKVPTDIELLCCALVAMI
ncbi:MAG: hypothetical protein DMG50_29460, partial [Acidobacteria bacterium]